jgi:hypothetical protein
MRRQTGSHRGSGRSAADRSDVRRAEESRLNRQRQLRLWRVHLGLAIPLGEAPDCLSPWNAPSGPLSRLRRGRARRRSRLPPPRPPASCSLCPLRAGRGAAVTRAAKPVSGSYARHPFSAHDVGPSPPPRAGVGRPPEPTPESFRSPTGPGAAWAVARGLVALSVAPPIALLIDSGRLLGSVTRAVGFVHDALTVDQNAAEPCSRPAALAIYRTTEDSSPGGAGVATSPTPPPQIRDGEGASRAHRARA